MSSEKAFRRSQAAATAGGSGDGVPRPPRYLRHSVILSKKSASICEIHPPQYCPSSAMLLLRTGYGGRVCGSNPVFKIKNPSQNAQKLLKVNKGQLSLVDTPRGVCQSTCQNRPHKNAKVLIFNGIIRFLTVKLMSYFTPKNLRFMPYFLRNQFINIIQSFCLRRITRICRVALSLMGLINRPIAVPSPLATSKRGEDGRGEGQGSSEHSERQLLCCSPVGKLTLNSPGSQLHNSEFWLCVCHQSCKSYCP